jgi:hypothetical protein
VAPADDPWGSGLVTPEGVVLELDAAGVPSRALSAAVDLIVQVAAVAIPVTIAAVIGRPSWLLVVVTVVSVFLALFAYPALSETFMRGRSLGKVLVGLRVVTVEGRSGALPSRRDPFGPGHRGRVARAAGLHRGDHVVVQPAQPAARRPGRRHHGAAYAAAHAAVQAVHFPAPVGLEAYAASLDVGSLGPEQYQVVRAYLLRARRWPCPARHTCHG